MTVPPSELMPSDEVEEARSAEQADDSLLPTHRRFWGYYNRPYVGCGFLWTALVLLLIYFLLLWFFPSLVPSVY